MELALSEVNLLTTEGIWESTNRPKSQKKRKRYQKIETKLKAEQFNQPLVVDLGSCKVLDAKVLKARKQALVLVRNDQEKVEILLLSYPQFKMIQRSLVNDKTVDALECSENHVAVYTKHYMSQIEILKYSKKGF